MNATTLVEVYDWMRGIGLCANKRQFSLSWCGRGRTYLRDYIEDGRLGATVPGAVVDRLRGRLAAVGALVPMGAAHEIMSMVERIDRAAMVHRLLAR